MTILPSYLCTISQIQSIMLPPSTPGPACHVLVTLQDLIDWNDVIAIKEEVLHFSNIGPKCGLTATELTSIYDFCVFENLRYKKLD